MARERVGRMFGEGVGGRVVSTRVVRGVVVGSRPG